ncbi:hypothetical protein L218DRAFT_1002118 [Marasmius fiardii PR-910]|nr:hypothetical protein L218DRAFT_1002118 [Marasmius fiardii PR-910]
MKLSSTLIVLVAFATSVSAQAASSGSGCNPLLRGNQPDLQLHIAGPSNQLFDSGNGTNTRSESVMPTQTSGSGASQSTSDGRAYAEDTPENIANPPPISNDELKAEFDWVQQCIPRHRNAALGWFVGRSPEAWAVGVGHPDLVSDN